MDSFLRLGLPEPLASALASLGFAGPTPVQEEAIPLALAGRDLLIESETGTGKTFAYLAPILALLGAGESGSGAAKGPFAIVAAPTQELAVQIGREVERLAKAAGMEVEAAVILGGSPLGRQEAALKRGPSVVVGTLGRLADLAYARILRLGRLRFLVLDEADRLFAPETEELCARLLDSTPRQAARILASATLPERTRRAAAPWLRDPVQVAKRATEVLSKDIEHWCFYCDSRKRLDFVRRLEAAIRPERCLLFHANAARLGKALETLESFGLPVAAISARRDKEERRVALDRFARGELRYLLTSDLGARGLDIAGVTHVLSLDLPEEGTVYVHRAGRTGRAGSSGVSIVLADSVELKRASRLAIREGFVFRTKVLREGRVLEPPVEEFFEQVEEAERKRSEARARNAETPPPSRGKGRPAEAARRPGKPGRQGRER